MVFSVGVAELLQMKCYTYCTVLSTLRNFTLHSAVHHWRVTSVGDQEEKLGSKTGTGWQAAQPLIVRVKHPETVQCKTVAVTDMSNKLPACCP